MKEGKNIHETALRELIRKTELETPSEYFTANVMKKIEQLVAQPAISTVEKDPLNKWIISGLSLAILTIGGFILYYYNISLIPNNFKPVIVPVFMSIVNTFQTIFESIKISSVTLVIILGFIVLVALERILNKLKITRNIYFSIY